MHHLLSRIPNRCVVCHLSATRHNLCACCLADLPHLLDCCALCACPFNTAHHSICGPCLVSPPPWHRMISALCYATPVNVLLPRLKYQGDLMIARALAQVMTERIAARLDSPPDAIVPLPLHWRRQWQRGFNQSHELARFVGNALAIPLNTRLCRRIKPTREQASLDHRRRRANVRNAFHVCKAVGGLRLAVVDDVLTTGATMASLCHALLNAGALNVEVWTCARVLKPHSRTGMT